MTAYETEPAEAEPASRAGGLRDRLVPPIPGSPIWGWVGPLLVTAFGAFLRFYRLGVPHAVVFDETYYVGDAYGILRHGVEINHVKNANALLAQGKTNILSTGGELAVHPPLGKVFIAAGEWLFGLTPFGWRFAVAVVGSLSILMTARITRRMTRSTLLGCVAGLLLALDGLEFVLSRTAILDIFVMFWVLAAFGCLVIDRDWSRARIADAARQRAPDNAGPSSASAGGAWRPGSASGGLRVEVERDLVPAGVVVPDRGMGPGRAPRGRVPGPAAGRAVRRLKWLPVTFVVPGRGLPGLLERLVRLAVRLRPELGGPARQPHAGLVGAGLAVPVQRYMLQFGRGPDRGHPYRSGRGPGVLTGRSRSSTPPRGRCGVQEVLAGGAGHRHPADLVGLVPALLVCLAWWLARRDWRAGAVLAGVPPGGCRGSGSLHDNRTEFYFYAVVFDPFLVIGITLCIGLIIGPARASPARRATGAVLSGAYLLAVLWDFYYMYPVLAAQVVPYTTWLSRMWYHGWI